MAWGLSNQSFQIFITDLNTIPKLVEERNTGADTHLDVGKAFNTASKSFACTINSLKKIKMQSELL